MCSTGHGPNGILFIGRGLVYHKTEETDFYWTSYGRNGILLIGRGVAYRKMEETDLCWSATVETGVLFIGRGVAYCKTGLNRILFISTIDCLHEATVHPLSTASTGSYSSTVDLLQPPPATVHPTSTG